MNGEIISYLELCVREKAHLQHGMNWRIQSTHSVFLMSTRKGSPYDDRIEDEGRTLIYEGHDAPKNTTSKDPKTVDQPGRLPSGKLTRNGIFAEAAEAHKEGLKDPERIRVYEKIRPSIWTYNGEFLLLDQWLEESNNRQVYKFRLTLSEEPLTVDTDVVSTSRPVALYRVQLSKLCSFVMVESVWSVAQVTTFTSITYCLFLKVGHPTQQITCRYFVRGITLVSQQK